jgi:predicted alpha/beta hydrolase
MGGPDVPSPAAVVVINAGAGIGFGYYDRFAQFLAANGLPTLIYDYRGIGQSRPKALRGFVASVEVWGSKDCTAALGWLSSRFPGARHIVVGHSVGSFVTGFVTNRHKIDWMLLVGAHTGYWREYAARGRLRMYLLWHVLMPALTRALGYFPGPKLHLLEDLPAGAALECAKRRWPKVCWNVALPDGRPDLSRLNRKPLLSWSISNEVDVVLRY